MKLTKEQFVTHVNFLLDMSKDSTELSNALGCGDFIFDTWFDYYYTLVEEMCEFPEEIHHTWYGSPLAYWIFTAEGVYSPTAYIDLNEEEVYFHSTEEVYDYIISSTT